MKCKECQKEFTPWKRVITCPNGCDDGVYEEDRDYGMVMTTCYCCKGNGEIMITETDFCSEDCIEEHVYIAGDDLNNRK